MELVELVELHFYNPLSICVCVFFFFCWLSSAVPFIFILPGNPFMCQCQCHTLVYFISFYQNVIDVYFLMKCSVIAIVVRRQGRPLTILLLTHHDILKQNIFRLLFEEISSQTTRYYPPFTSEVENKETKQVRFTICNHCLSNYLSNGFIDSISFMFIKFFKFLSILWIMDEGLIFWDKLYGL